VTGNDTVYRSETDALAAVRTLLRWIGEDPDRDGLIDTPSRVIRAIHEMTRGYAVDPASVLTTVFEQRHDQMIQATAIGFASLCEHHLLPFIGTVDIAYLPANGQILGLSKLARCVDVLARRLQVQERMTDGIMTAIADTVPCDGVAVRVRASHACAGVRGVRQPGMVMTTIALRGAFLENAATRSEWLAGLPA
jgi:GTP cyclohydrolase I